MGILNHSGPKTGFLCPETSSLYDKFMADIPINSLACECKRVCFLIVNNVRWTVDVLTNNKNCVFHFTDGNYGGI